MGTSNIFSCSQVPPNLIQFDYVTINWVAQPPLFGSVIWKDHPFANATFMLMLYLKFLEPLSWKFCVYFVSFSIKSFFCQSNSARIFLSTIKVLRYPPPLSQKNTQTSKQMDPDPSWRPYPRVTSTIIIPIPIPSNRCNQPTNQPTDGTAEPTCLGKQQLLESFLLSLRCAFGGGFGEFDGGCGGKGEVKGWIFKLRYGYFQK